MARLSIPATRAHDAPHGSADHIAAKRAGLRPKARPFAADAHELRSLVSRRADPARPGPRRGSDPAQHELDRVTGGPLRSLAAAPRRCTCGGIPGPDGECEQCRARRLTRQATAARRRPTRVEPGAEPELDEEGPPIGRPPLPHQGDATIVCDGRGGYRVSMGWAASAACGIGDCVRRHEQSHIADWQRRWPNGCKSADGSAKADGATVPTGGPGYAAFLRQSECTAYGVEIPCEEALLRNATDACKPTIQTVLADSRRQRTRYCAAPSP